MFSILIFLSILIGMNEAGVIGHHSSGHAVSSQNVVLHHDQGVYLDDDHHSDKKAYPKYQFTYSVNDGYTKDNKQHWESRDGGNVQGEYSLLQPDGSTRTVTYTADDHKGFEAVVSHSGGADYSHRFA